MARILLLDEDTPLRTITCSALRVAGHQVVMVATGEDVIARVTSEPFDLILVDLSPPDMDGIAMLRQLALVTGHGGTPIVTMGDQGQEHRLLAAAEAGAVDHLRKPFGFGILDATVKRLVTATPERVDDLRVTRKQSADLYRQTIDLMQDVKSG